MEVSLLQVSQHHYRRLGRFLHKDADHAPAFCLQGRLGFHRLFVAALQVSNRRGATDGEVKTFVVVDETNHAMQ